MSDNIAASTTKIRILTSAIAEFAAVGLAGARVDRIAANAKINKQRIYAYFGNKASLFDAAVAEAFRQLRTTVPVASGPDDLVDYAMRLYDFHVRDQSLSRLLMWEQLERPLETGGKRPGHHSARVNDYVKGVTSDDPEESIRLSLVLVSLAAWPSGNRQVLIDVTSSDARSAQRLLEGPMRDTVERAARAVVNAWKDQRPAPEGHVVTTDAVPDAAAP